MKKEIKFRAWDRGNEKMIPWENGVDNYVCEDLGNDDYFFMQYIDLKDKDSKEIYEGDIIQYESNGKGLQRAKVLWSMNTLGYLMEHTTGAQQMEIPRTPEKRLIVGNINENPELLND